MLLLVSCMQQEVCSVAAHICQRIAHGSSHSRRSDAEADPEQPQDALKRALLTKSTPTLVSVLVQRPAAAQADMRFCITSSDFEVTVFYQKFRQRLLASVSACIGRRHALLSAAAAALLAGTPLAAAAVDIPPAAIDTARAPDQRSYDPTDPELRAAANLLQKALNATDVKVRAGTYMRECADETSQIHVFRMLTFNPSLAL